MTRTTSRRYRARLLPPAVLVSAMAILLGACSGGGEADDRSDAADVVAEAPDGGEADPYPFQSVYENGEGLAVVITDVRTDVPGSEACGGEGDPGNTYLAATIQAANVLEEGGHRGQ